MSNFPCEIIEDLLPSYIDALASETTRQAVSEHLEGCPSCKEAFERMSAPQPSEAPGDQKAANFLKKIQAHKRGLAALAATLGALLSLVFILQIPASLPSSAMRVIDFSVDEDFRAVIEFPVPYAGAVNIRPEISPDGIHLSASTNLLGLALYNILGADSGQDTGTAPSLPVSSYFISASGDLNLYFSDGKSDILIWEPGIPPEDIIRPSMGGGKMLNFFF